MTASLAYRPFTAWWEPTMRASIAGRQVCTICSAQQLFRHGVPTPVYDPATAEYAVISIADFDESLIWTCVGWFGTIYTARAEDHEAQRLGEYHLPDSVVREMQDYLNTYVADHPDTPLIPRIELAYQRNSYRTYHESLFTYNQLCSHAAGSRGPAREFHRGPASRNIESARGVTSGASRKAYRQS